MAQRRVIDIQDGIAMVVTDLHGEGEVYNRLRDVFLKLRDEGKADRMILCGDLIHGYGNEAEDASLTMVLDVMRLQKELSKDTVIMLLGNHEMPHIYSITLSKGDMVFTPRFEKQLALLDKDESREYSRADVINFLKELPFYACTKSGVLVTHAGASPAIKTPSDAEQLLNFDHETLLALGDGLVKGYDMMHLRNDTGYSEQASILMSVDDPNSPYFTHLLRGMLISHESAAFQFLWDVLFATNEMGGTVEAYSVVAQAFLKAVSAHSHHEQRVIVAGHIGVQGGYKLVGDHHFRLATYAHAHPNHAGQYLLLDCETPIRTAEDLVPYLCPTIDTV